MKSRKVKAYNKASGLRKNPSVDLPIDASDDSEVDSESFYHDDIDDFNNDKDNELSTDDELIQERSEPSEEEEVLPITDDENESDSEKDDKDDDLPNREAWGRKKSMYFSTDFVDQDRGRTYREADAEAAKAEEDEAIAIQKSVFSNINADNLGAHLFFESSEESADEEEMVKNIATKQEIIKYLEKETKFFEYKALWESSVLKLKIMLKLWHLIKTKRIRSQAIEQYVRIKKQILNIIIHNIHIYFLFASAGKNPKHHPVNQRIAQFKQFLDNLESADYVLSSAIDKILQMVDLGEEINISSEIEEDNNTVESAPQSGPKVPAEIAIKTRKAKKSKVKQTETENEREILQLIYDVKEVVKKRKLEELPPIDDQPISEDEAVMDQDENNMDEKRVISYQIAKNKGLVPHRKKEYRNPRVRHRMKFRKAQIRRKGQVRNVIKEIKRYEGEPTGINANVVKSIKFK